MTRLPRRLALISLALFAMVAWVRAGDWTPEAYPIERYEHIWKSSPFVAATEITPAGESVAARFAITGFVEVAGKQTVFVLDRSTNNRFLISPEDMEKHGLRILSLEHGGNLKNLVAKVRVGTQTAELRYDPATTGTAVANQTVAANTNEPPQSRRFRPPDGSNASNNDQHQRPMRPPVRRVIRRPGISVTQ